VGGQTLLKNPYASQSCFAPDQSAFVTQVTDTTDWNDDTGNTNDFIMWQIGAYQATVNSTGNWSFVDATIDTQTRTANWDWYTAAEHCYTYGTGTDAGCSSVTVPNSFYLSSKPAFFGSQTWPWVDGTKGNTYILPAMYCFQHGQMPTCLQ
jgi:hypothetical protein